MYKRFKFVLSAVFFIIILYGSCQKEDETRQKQITDIEYKFINANTLASGLEFPSGLTSERFDNGRKSTIRYSELVGTFIEGPLYKNFWAEGGLKPVVNPKIMKFLINLDKNPSSPADEITMSLLYEFDLEKYSADFDASPILHFSLIDSLTRFSGLNLNGLILNDGCVLVTSNSSDKLFKINTNGSFEVFCQSDDLVGISDVIQGIDNIIYATQTQQFDVEKPLIISTKKLISITNGLINTELELPSFFNYSDPLHGWSYWKEAPFIERIRITENSSLGKQRFGSKFYISDLLDRKIYKVDEINNVEVLADLQCYPSSVVVDSLGTVFYTTSPLWKTVYYNTLTSQTKIFALNPETGMSTELYTFTETLNDYIHTGCPLQIRGDDGSAYVIPLGYNVTNILYENRDTLVFFFTNSHQGTIKKISIQRTAN